MKKYKVCVVGAGAVGTEMVRLLKRRNFPMDQLTIFARSAREEVIDGEKYEVRVAAPESFSGMDFAFFAGTEGVKGASQLFGWEAVKRGCIVIDNGDDFRMDPRVPLVIPEINPHALQKHQGFIANPNCSTIIALMALAPLHKFAKIRRFVSCTYQAVSGTGSAAIRELADQVKAWVGGKPIRNEVYPCQIAFNVIPQVGGSKTDEPGCTSEELKMRRETHKILEDNTIRVASTCVRVPVFNGHSEALHIELVRPVSVEQVRDVLSASPGITLVDDLSTGQFPTPLACSGKYEVLVGRIRLDSSVENGVAMFVAGDNIWKGAAQNAIQIAEHLISGTGL